MDALRLAPDGAKVPAMMGDDESRGAAIRRRLNALGISDRDWMTQTGIDIKTVHRAIEEKPGTRPGSYLAIEAALDKLEAAMAGDPSSVRLSLDPAEGLVEFSVSGDFGVNVVVKGPIADREAIEESVIRLVRAMRRD